MPDIHADINRGRSDSDIIFDAVASVLSSSTTSAYELLTQEDLRLRAIGQIGGDFQGIGVFGEDVSGIPDTISLRPSKLGAVIALKAQVKVAIESLRTREVVSE